MYLINTVSGEGIKFDYDEFVDQYLYLICASITPVSFILQIILKSLL